MNRSDLCHVNLNLLLIFEALMQARSVSLAAERMFLGQPAVSSALARLRTLFNDPLFRRAGRYMEPTPRAQEIALLLSPALESIAQAVSRPSGFEPASSDRVFRIGMSDDIEFALLPPLLRRIRSEAPGVALVVRRADYRVMPRLLASGEITVGVGYTTDLPAAAKRRTLRPIQNVMLRGDQAPGDLNLQQFCARPHALVSFAGGTVGFVDDALRRLGLERRVVLAVPNFNSLGALLEGTDLVAAVPDYVADVFTASGRLRAQPMPLQTLELTLHMVWNRDKDNDPAERWLRSRISLFLGEKSVITDLDTF